MTAGRTVAPVVRGTAVEPLVPARERTTAVGRDFHLTHGAPPLKRPPAVSGIPLPAPGLRL